MAVFIYFFFCDTKKEVKDKKLISFLLAGLLFIAVGFILGRNSKEKDLAIRHSVLSHSASNPEKEKVFISEVIDGDTVETVSHEKIRYLGINAPEKDEPLFGEALKLNESLVLGKSIKLEFDVQTKDRYGRILAYVFIDDNFVNLEMVKLSLIHI